MDHQDYMKSLTARELAKSIKEHEEMITSMKGEMTRRALAKEKREKAEGIARADKVDRLRTLVQTSVTASGVPASDNPLSIVCARLGVPTVDYDKLYLALRTELHKGSDLFD